MVREGLEGIAKMRDSMRRLLAASVLAVSLTVPGPQATVARTSLVPPAPASITSTSLVVRILEALGITVPWPPTGIEPLSPVSTGTRLSKTSGPRRLPSNLTPSLKDAASIKPRSYSDGCHRRNGQTTVKTCIYGDAHGTRSVVLFGDSHAAMWLPALDSIAARRGWKLYSVTKSACPVAKVARGLPGHSTTDCDTWRKNAQAFIARIHPDLVIAANVERQGSAGQPSYSAWNAGMLASLTTLVGHADKVVLFGETPVFRSPLPACLSKHRRDTRRCDSPRSFALSSRRQTDEKATAAAAGAVYVRLSDITCPDSPCASVIGRYMVSYDDQHMSLAFVKHLIPKLEPKLPLP